MTMTMTAEQLMALYESGASLRQLSREDGRSYEGVRKAMLSLPDGEARLAAEQGRREDDRKRKKAEGRIQRTQQRQHDLARSRTQIDHRTERPPVVAPPKEKYRSDRIANDVILSALSEWLLDPDAEGRGPSAYERWRAEKDAGYPSAPTAIGRFGSWSNAKAIALNAARDKGAA
jgi:hypothetical protein